MRRVGRGSTGLGLSLFSVYSLLPPLPCEGPWAHGGSVIQEWSPSPTPSREKLEDGPELSLTFSSPTFQGPAGFGRLAASANLVPSPQPPTQCKNLLLLLSSLPSVISQATHAPLTVEVRHPQAAQGPESLRAFRV